MRPRIPRHMSPRGERPPESSAKKEGGGLKREAAEVIDLDDDDVVVRPPVAQQAIVIKERVEKSKEELKKEIKAEVQEKQRRKEKKAAKVKREKGGDDAPEKHKGGSEKVRGEERGRNRDRSRSKKRKAESSSTSSSSEESSMSDLYRKFKPYTKVCLRNLVRKADLNGMTGQVIHPSTSVCPCPPGCVLVRLETGREIGVKPANLAALQAFHRGPQQAGLTQEARLKSVLTQIKLNQGDVCDAAVSRGSGPILDDLSAVQGGIGHML